VCKSSNRSGGKIHNYFCPQCGSTVYWKISNLPALIAVAVGAMAEPKYPAPVISVFEASQKIQTETPPKILVSEELAHQR
jgi:hypothetical protein